MSDASISIDRTHTTRIPATVADDVNGTPIDITAVEIIVRLVNTTATVVLTEGAGVTVISAVAGQWAYDVTAANLLTLGNPETVDAFVTIFNADDTLLLKTSYSMNVTD